MCKCNECVYLRVIPSKMKIKCDLQNKYLKRSELARKCVIGVKMNCSLDNAEK